MGTVELADLKDRFDAIERSHNEMSRVVAVLSNDMAGIKKILSMILAALIVGIVGAFITAWVQIPQRDYHPTTPRTSPGLETPR